MGSTVPMPVAQHPSITLPPSLVLAFIPGPPLSPSPPLFPAYLQVLDPRTRMVLFKMLNRGVFSQINGCLSTGKEVRKLSSSRSAHPACWFHMLSLSTGREADSHHDRGNGLHEEASSLQSPPRPLPSIPSCNLVVSTCLMHPFSLPISPHSPIPALPHIPIPPLSPPPPPIMAGQRVPCPRGPPRLALLPRLRERGGEREGARAGNQGLQDVHSRLQVREGPASAV